MTTDIRIEQSPGGAFDFIIDENGDLGNGDFFDSSLIYSLYGERRASASEVPTSENRRGWIGNEGSDYENGSKIWLYEQARITRSNLNGIQAEALASLQWLVDDGFLASITATAVISNGGVALNIELFRFNSIVDRRFYQLWENTGA